MKLFLSDVDGTLLRGGCDLPEAVIEAARRFVAAGGFLGLSTGRPLSAVRRLVAQLPVNAPCVLCSGALIYDFKTERKIRVSCLDPAVFPLLRRILEEAPEISVTVYMEDGLRNLRVNRRLQTQGVFEDRTAPFAQLDEIRAPIKILLTCDDSRRLIQIGRDWVHPSLFEFHAASRHFYELTPKNVCKGAAAQAICAMLGKTEPCRLFTAGDAASDWTMKPVSEKFFVPETAPEPLRVGADYVFPAPEKGGLARALELVRELP